MGKGGSAPVIPDPNGVINAATQSNIQTAIANSQLNNVNQNNPWGSISYQQTGTGANGVPIYTQTQTLNPTLQGALNSQFGAQNTTANIAERLASQMGQTLSRPLNRPGFQNHWSPGPGNATGPVPGNEGRMAGMLGEPMQGDVGPDGGGTTPGTTPGGGGGTTPGTTAGTTPGTTPTATPGAPVPGNNWPNFAASGTGGPNYTGYGNGPQLNTAGGSAGAIQTSLGSNDFSADRQRVEDALMGRLNTQIGRDRGAMEASLANRGIRLGSQAYSDAMQDFDRGVAENRTSAILGAGQEQNRLQGLALNAGNFANSAQNQGFQQSMANAGFGNQALQQMFQNVNSATGANNNLVTQQFQNDITGRNQEINQLMSLLSGSQVQQPQFGSTNQVGVGGVDAGGIMQNNYNQQMQQYQMQQQQNNSLMGGLFGLGSSALMAFSDERLKTDIEPTGEKIAGVPVKSWTWKGSGERDVGVIAQEVEKKHPELVDRSHPSGYRRVDYGGLMKLGASAMKEAA